MKISELTLKGNKKFVFGEDVFLIPANVRWKCERCGRCCLDNKRIPLFKEEVEEIKRRTGKDDFYVFEVESEHSASGYMIKFPCPFYNAEEKKCEIYSFRPLVCRSFPFKTKYSDTHVFLDDKACEGFSYGTMTKEELKPFAEVVKKEYELIGKSMTNLPDSIVKVKFRRALEEIQKMGYHVGVVGGKMLILDGDDVSKFLQTHGQDAKIIASVKDWDIKEHRCVK